MKCSANCPAIAGQQDVSCPVQPQAGKWTPNYLPQLSYLREILKLLNIMKHTPKEMKHTPKEPEAKSDGQPNISYIR